MNQVSIENTLLWETTSGHWMANSSGGSSRGIPLTFTYIPVGSKHTSRYATHSPPAFFTVPKRFFFSPSYRTLKKILLLFVWMYLAAFLPTTMHSLLIEKKVYLKEISRMFSVHVCHIDSNIDRLQSFKICLQQFWLFQINSFGPEFAKEKLNVQQI